jgi:putative transposase
VDLTVFPARRADWVGGEGAVMTTTLNDMTAKKKPAVSAEELAARELVAFAKEQGLSLTGPDGLLKQFTKNVLETALNEEMTEHLGHEKNRVPEGRESTNIRNGTRPKTVLTHATGQVELDVPRDRDGTFEPVIVRKRQRRLGEVDEIVLSLYARGLTTGEIAAHFDEIYGASVSKETVSRITDKVVEEMQAWASRPLDEVYAAIFIDAIVVKIRDGQVANRPVYAAIGVTLRGEKDVLGLWAGTGGEGGEVLDGRAHRSTQPRRPRRLLRGLRRPQGPAGGGRERVAVGHGPDVGHPSDP